MGKIFSVLLKLWCAMGMLQLALDVMNEPNAMFHIPIFLTVLFVWFKGDKRVVASGILCFIWGILGMLRANHPTLPYSELAGCWSVLGCVSSCTCCFAGEDDKKEATDDKKK